MLEMGPEKTYADGEDTSGRRGCPCKCLDSLRDTMNPRKGTQGCWKVSSGERKEGIGNWHWGGKPLIPSSLDNIASLGKHTA